MPKVAILVCALSTIVALSWAFGLGPNASAEAIEAEGFAIQVEIEGISGFFTEVSGLGSENTVVEYRVGDAASSFDGDDEVDDSIGSDGTNQKVVKVPGRLKWGDITLKRTISSNLDIWEWRKMVETGEAGYRKNGSIILFDLQLGEPVARWNFTNAWPSKVTGPSFKADSNDVALESIVLVHEGIRRSR